MACSSGTGPPDQAGSALYFQFGTSNLDVANEIYVRYGDLPSRQTYDIRSDQGLVANQWLVVYGNCTHLGCVPLGNQGEYHGWFCPCHGSVFDTAGRIRGGPAPINLPIPPYTFVSDTKVKIGEGGTAAA